MNHFMLTDEQWSAVQPHLPRSTATTGRPMADRRLMFEAMLFQLTTGCPWRHLPRERFGPYQTVYHHFNRWRKQGMFDRSVDRLRIEADVRGLIDWSLLGADGTSVRAAASAARGAGGPGAVFPPAPRARRRRLSGSRAAPAAAPKGSALSCTC